MQFRFSFFPTYDWVVWFSGSGTANDKDALPIESTNGAAPLPSLETKPEQTGQNFFLLTSACLSNSCSAVWSHKFIDQKD